MTVRDISTLEAVYSNMADIPGLPDAYQPRNIAAALKVMRATPYPQFAADECDRLATAHTQLQASLSAANARADQARDAALEDVAKEAHAFAAENQWRPSSVTKLVTRILALRDKPAPAVTVQKAILEVWGCCEELEDEALAKLSGVKTEHEKGFWTGQKMTAKRIRRATQMPIAGGGDE